MISRKYIYLGIFLFFFIGGLIKTYVDAEYDMYESNQRINQLKENMQNIDESEIERKRENEYLETIVRPFHLSDLNPPNDYYMHQLQLQQQPKSQPESFSTILPEKQYPSFSQIFYLFEEMIQDVLDVFNYFKNYLFHIFFYTKHAI